MAYNHGHVGQPGPRRTRRLYDVSRLLRCLKSDESADAPVELAVILLANNEYVLDALATLFGQPLLDHPLRGAEIQLADENFQGVNIQCPLHCARSNGAKKHMGRRIGAQPEQQYAVPIKGDGDWRPGEVGIGG